MPSMAHEILVDLFKNRPSLAAEILDEVLGVSLPPYSEARLASTDLTEIQPAEYRADVVVVLFDGDVPVRVIIVEVQLAADPRKRFSWPAYVTVSRTIHGCPADLLIVAPDPAVAGWCAEPRDRRPRGSNPGYEKVDRSDDLRAVLRDLGNRGSQLALGDTGELRCQHHERLAFDHQKWRQGFQGLPFQGGSRVERHHNPGFQAVQQIVLDVEKEGTATRV
jgi:hypothetical protein